MRTERGGGRYGYTGLFLHLLIYHQLPGMVAWVLALYPGPTVQYGDVTTVAEREVRINTTLQWWSFIPTTMSTNS